MYINACVREHSRTKRLADRLVGKLKIEDNNVHELRLDQISFPTADEDFLKKRDSLLDRNKYEDSLFDLARQFAEADQIVIAAPYWDLSFPASLKQYFEQINVVGVTFSYTPEGIPQGQCKARRLYYVMTAGGSYAPDEYGYGYVKALAESYYQIPETRLIQALGLDIEGADVEAILANAFAELEQMFN